MCGMDTPKAERRAQVTRRGLASGETIDSSETGEKRRKEPARDHEAEEQGRGQDSYGHLFNLG